MAKIPEYKQTIIAPRQTPQLADFSRISGEGSTSNLMVQLSELAEKHRDAMEATELNASVIANKKEKIEFMDKARQQNMGDPTDFAKLMDEEFRKIDERYMEGMSSRVKTQFQLTSQNINLGFLDDNMRWQNQRQTEIHAEKIEQAANDLGVLAFRAGKTGGNIDDLLKDADATVVASSLFIAPEKLQDVKRKLHGDITSTWISGMAEKDPYMAKKLLDSGKYDKDLGGDGLESAYNTVTHKQKSIEAAAKEIKLQESADLDIAIDMAESFDEINELKKRTEEMKGIISPSAYASKMIRANHKIEEIEKENETRIKVTTALEGKEPLDMSDSDVKKAVGKQYKMFVSQITDQQDGKQAEARASFAAQIGSIPNEMKNEISTLLRSKDVNQAVLGANTINIIRTRNPEMASDVNDETLRQANLIMSNISSGYDPAEAVKKVREISAVDLSTKEARKQEYKKEEGNKPSSKYLSKELSEWLSIDPDIDSIMVEEFSRAAENEYMLTGDIDSARQTALGLTLKSWGKSGINGKTKWMKNPPEKYYSLSNLGNSENTEWMRLQLEKDLSPLNIETESVNLVADTRNVSRPSYIIMHKNESGIINVLLDKDGKPMYWRPDSKYVVESAREKRGNK